MKLFLYKVSLFIAVLIGYFLINTAINYYFIASFVPEEEGNHYNYVFSGDSHIQESFDYNKFNNAFGIAKSGEPYFITFWKLKYLTDWGITIDTLILGLGNHNVSDKEDKSLVSKEAISNFEKSYAFHRYSPRDSVEIDYYKYANVIFRKCLLFPAKDHYHYKNIYDPGFLKLPDRDFYDDGLKKFHHYYYKEQLCDISIVNLNYLDSIIKLCNNLKTKLILVGTPVSKKYYRAIPDKFKEAYEKNKERYTEKGITVIDNTQLDFNDTLFMDFDHLNYYGCQVYMDYFKNNVLYNN
jgi:hypothetical protein